jgi:hypothetical protein
LTRASNEIRSEFFSRPQWAYRISDHAAVLRENRGEWKLAESTGPREFIAFLLKHKILKTYKLRADAYGSEIERYGLPGTSPLALAVSIRSSGYLSHATALRLHGLSIGAQNPIYVNVEQSQKPAPTLAITQEGIDRAFSGRQRRSNMIYTSGRNRIVLLSGKNTGRLGVETLAGLDGANVERTLIDVVVRPAYAGGSEIIRKAYRRARSRVSVGRLLSTYKALGYLYPYHQTIGFLMEITGYAPEAYETFRALGTEHDFYLEHGLENPEHSSAWRVYYPRGFLSK